MARSARYHVPFRRRRDGKTDYRKRLALLKSDSTRLVVRRSLNHIAVQLVNYIPQGDQVVFTQTSKVLKTMGWTYGTSNIPAAYLVGYLVGKEALKQGISNVVLDIGRIKPVKGSRVFATLKGAVDAGLEIPHGESVLPPEDRLFGRHIHEKVEEEVKNVISKINKEKE